VFREFHVEIFSHWHGAKTRALTSLMASSLSRAMDRPSSQIRLSSYYLSTSIVDLPLSIFYPLLYTIITYWMVGMRSSVEFLAFLGVIFLDVLVAQVGLLRAHRWSWL